MTHVSMIIMRLARLVGHSNSFQAHLSTCPPAIWQVRAIYRGMKAATVREMSVIRWLSYLLHQCDKSESGLKWKFKKNETARCCYN